MAMLLVWSLMGGCRYREEDFRARHAFPNTAEGALWDDPRDAEFNEMMLAIPKDRDGGMPPPERIFGSLPITDFQAITIPELAAYLRQCMRRCRMEPMGPTDLW